LPVREAPGRVELDARALVATPTCENQAVDDPSLLAEEETKKRSHSWLSLDPLAPVRRTHVNGLFGPRFNPAAEDPAAGENKRMRAVSIDNSQLKIAVKGRGGYRFPFHWDNLEVAATGALI
jgi:hypothetical protein